jgi:hypothetical protein
MFFGPPALAVGAATGFDEEAGIAAIATKVCTSPTARTLALAGLTALNSAQQADEAEPELPEQMMQHEEQLAQMVRGMAAEASTWFQKYFPIP